MLAPGDQDRICAAARSYLGVPWRGQGRDRMGLDCLGIVRVSYRDAGYDVDEGPVIYRTLDPVRMMAVLLRYWYRLDRSEDPAPADLVVFGVPQEAHLGLLVDGSPLNMIHAPTGRKVVEARFDPNRGNIRGIYRWR